MGFWNFAKKLHWKDANATLEQGVDFGQYASASEGLVQIDTPITTVRMAMAVANGVTNATVLCRCRISATDSSVIQVRRHSVAGDGSPATFNYLVWGDL
jgi:hypothetical protein